MGPDSPKEDILAAIFAGEKVHKISPAFPVSWTGAEIHLMAQHVFKTGLNSKENNRTHPTEIPAVNYLNQPISGGILGWVNRVRTGHLLKHNPKITRGGRIRPGSRSNRQLWREASHILIAEYEYWSDVLKANRHLMSTGRGYLVKYPRIGHLPFRDNDVFLGGEWSQFSSFWDPFISSIRY